MRAGPLKAEDAPPPDPATHGELAASPQFRAVFDLLSEGAALFDADDRFVVWNRRYGQIYGLSAPALRPGAAFRAFLEHGLEVGQYLDARGRKAEWLRERLDPAADAGFQEHLPGDRWVRVKHHRMADGGSLRVVTDTTGVTRTESSFRLLFEASPLPMCVADAKTLEILAVNEAAVAKYGYPRDVFLKLRTPDLAAPDERGSTDEIMRSDLRSYHGEEVWRQQTATGRLLRIRPYVRPLAYEGRGCLLVVAVDVTAAMDAHAELHAQSVRLGDLGERSRKPVDDLLTLTRTLMQSELSPEHRALVDEARAVAVTLAELLNPLGQGQT
jgi:PAS domain S-box-containing protein